MSNLSCITDRRRDRDENSQHRRDRHSEQRDTHRIVSAADCSSMAAALQMPRHTHDGQARQAIQRVIVMVASAAADDASIRLADHIGNPGECRCKQDVARTQTGVHLSEKDHNATDR